MFDYFCYFHPIEFVKYISMWYILFINYFFTIHILFIHDMKHVILWSLAHIKTPNLILRHYRKATNKTKTKKKAKEPHGSAGI